MAFTQIQKQIASVIFTFAVYAYLVNWQVALLLVISIGFHEYSHLFAARQLGLKTGGFYLWPFLGGVAFVTEKYKTRMQNAIVALAGPLGGALLALVTLAAYKFTGIEFLATSVVWMCVLNLFNLLPLSFLDGGQTLNTITYSISRTLGLVCLTISTVVAVILLWEFNIVIAILIAFLGVPYLITEYKNWKAYQKGNTYLCDDSYLNPPQSLTGWEILLVLISWGVIASSLITTCLSLNIFPSIGNVHFDAK